MIEFRNVSKSYKKNNSRALDKISFGINNDEIVCLLGPNGAGKTTLIKCLTGLTIYDEGDILINGKKVVNGINPCKKDTEIVLDGARNIYWRAKVISNFYYFGALKGKSRKTINENIGKYDREFKIKELLHKNVCDLSLGQKQKVSLLTSILVEPSILILDEPSNGLDISSKNDLVNLILSLKKTNQISILITSHDSEFTKKISDRYVIIDQGMIRGDIENKGLSLDEITQKYLEIINDKEINNDNLY